MIKLTVEFKTLDELSEFLSNGPTRTITEIEALVEEVKPTPKNVGRKNKPGGGRPTGTTKGKVAVAVVAKKKPAPKKAAPKVAKPVVAEPAEPVEEFEIDAEEVEAEVELAEPANKEIMDAFDAEQDEIEAVQEEIFEEEAAKPISQVKAKNATKEDVSKVVMELLKRKKDEGKDGTKIATSILAAYKVKRIRDLDPGHYSNFVQKVQSVM